MRKFSILFACLMLSCSTTSLNFNPAPTTVVNEPDLSIPFVLRTTDLILARPVHNVKPSENQVITDAATTPTRADDSGLVAPSKKTKPRKQKQPVVQTRRDKKEPMAKAGETADSETFATTFMIQDVCPPLPAPGRFPPPGDREAATAMQCLKGVGVTAVPAPADELYEIRPPTGLIKWGRHTNLSVSYIENSLLIKDIGVKVEDKRADIIKNVGTAAATGFTLGGPIGAVYGAAIGVILPIVTTTGDYSLESGERSHFCDTKGSDAAPEKPALYLPVAIHLEDAKKTLQNNNHPGGCWKKLPNNSGWYYMMKWTGNPKTEIGGTINPEDFFAKTNRTSFPYSVCRSAEIYVAWQKEKRVVKAVFNTTVADSRHLRTMPLPDSGSITIGKVCGANLKVESSLDNSAAIDAAFTAAQNIVKASDTHDSQGTDKDKSSDSSSQ